MLALQCVLKPLGGKNSITLLECLRATERDTGDSEGRRLSPKCCGALHLPTTPPGCRLGSRPILCTSRGRPGPPHRLPGQTWSPRLHVCVAACPRRPPAHVRPSASRDPSLPLVSFPVPALYPSRAARWLLKGSTVPLRVRWVAVAEGRGQDLDPARDPAPRGAQGPFFATRGAAWHELTR